MVTLSGCVKKWQHVDHGRHVVSVMLSQGNNGNCVKNTMHDN